MTAAIPLEPIYIGEHALVAKFFVMARNPGDPRRIEGTFTIVGDDATLTLDAIVGPRGLPGAPSPIIRPQWGSTVTEVGDLPDVDTLDETDRGRAWYINGFWHVYDEDDDGTSGAYHVIQGSIAGPKGDTVTPTFSAELVLPEDLDPDQEANEIKVEKDGPTLTPNFHLKVPTELLQGPEGPSAAIENADDYTGPSAEPGQILGKTSETTWGAVDPIQRPLEKYSLPAANFTDYTGSAGRQLIGTLDVPAADFDRYVHLNGHVKISRPALFSSAQVEVEVRMGITGAGTGETQELVGLAPFDPIWSLLDQSAIAVINDHYSTDLEPTRAIAPDSSVGRLLEGNPYTFYVFTHRAGGAGSYTFTKGYIAQLNVILSAAPDA